MRIHGRHLRVHLFHRYHCRFPIAASSYDTTIVTIISATSIQRYRVIWGLLVFTIGKLPLANVLMLQSAKNSPLITIFRGPDIR